LAIFIRLIIHLAFADKTAIFCEVYFLSKQKGEKGDQYECNECGIVVTVENPCAGGCECEPCELMCCGEPMQEKSTSKSKSNK
jgi:hypothetical protein